MRLARPPRDRGPKFPYRNHYQIMHQWFARRWQNIFLKPIMVLGFLALVVFAFGSFLLLPVGWWLWLAYPAMVYGWALLGVYLWRISDAY